MVTVGSEKKVWWICEKGLEWEVSVIERTKGWKKCPNCKNVQNK